METTHFKFKDYRSVTKLIIKNFFLATIDMKDAYYLVPINGN